MESCCFCERSLLLAPNVSRTARASSQRFWLDKRSRIRGSQLIFGARSKAATSNASRAPLTSVLCFALGEIRIFRGGNGDMPATNTRAERNQDCSRFRVSRVAFARKVACAKRNSRATFANLRQTKRAQIQNKVNLLCRQNFEQNIFEFVVFNLEMQIASEKAANVHFRFASA